MRLLILGANGQLGRELTRAAQKASFDPTPLGRSQVDITDSDALQSAIGSGFDLVLNAAAYTAVERAEEEAEEAFRINSEGARQVAGACALVSVPMVHFSTDYVFDGAVSEPYTEVHQPNPLGVYGKSKRAGEIAVQRVLPQHIILRTSWVYAAHGHNFVRTMLALSEKQGRLEIVDDQTGCPTSARDLAEAVIALAPLLREERVPWGIYHCAGKGMTSWYGFAKETFRLRQEMSGLEPPILTPVPSSRYPTKCPRPKNSALDCSLLSRRTGIELRPWQLALRQVMVELMSQPVAENPARD